MTQPPLHPITPILPSLPAPLHLSNGTELRPIPIPASDITRLTLMFPGGQWTQATPLQADYAMRLIDAGTSTIPSHTLSERLDYYGATITTGTTTSYAFLTLTCHHTNLPHLIPLLRDILTDPTYPQTQLDIEREEGLLICQTNKQKAPYMANHLFHRHLLGADHPAAVLPEEQHVLQLKRESLFHYHHRHILLPHTTIFATGHITPATITLLDTLLGTITTTQTPTPILDRPIHTSTHRRHDSHLPVPTVQSALHLGRLLPPITSPHAPAITLTTTLLGGYFGSRLMKNIRERLGLTYGISAYLTQIPHHAILSIATETPTQHVNLCLNEIDRELHNLATTPVTPDELYNAKNYLMGQVCRTTEVSLSLPALCMNLLATSTDLDHMLQRNNIIQSLTPEDIMQCAATYFSPDDILISAVHGK